MVTRTEVGAWNVEEAPCITKMNDLRARMLEKYLKIRNSFLQEGRKGHCTVLVVNKSVLKKHKGSGRPILAVNIGDSMADQLPLCSSILPNIETSGEDPFHDCFIGCNDDF